MPPTNKYGITIKYTIPSFTASALVLFPSLVRAALHIAHCAFAVKDKDEKSIEMRRTLTMLPFPLAIGVVLLNIVRSNHYVHNNTRYSNI